MGKKLTVVKKLLLFQKAYFLRLLKKTLDLLKEHTSSNIISGFRKLGIYPLNKEEILKSLPSKNTAVDLEVVGESFLAHLEKKRCNAVTLRNTNRKTTTKCTTLGKASQNKIC